ncbi:MAG: transglutaminase domain-containing protein [Phycisphaerales bacterium]|nr:transglutaminase domain-containing protein [Phycisphaerales bacterium]
MNPSRFRPSSVVATALLAVAAWGTASGDAVRAALVAACLIVLGFATGGAGGRMPPRWIVNSLVLLAMLDAVRVAFERSLGVDEFARFLLWVLIIKMLDRRRPRDEAQLLALSVFLAFGAALTSNSLVTGLLLLAMLPTLGAAVMRHQIASAAERVRISRRRAFPPGASVPEVGAVAGRRFRRDLRRLNAFVFAGVFLLSAGVFVLMPRGLGMDRFGRWGNAGVGRVTGFSTKVDVGLGGLISESQTPVLDLTVFDVQRGVRLGGEGEVYYLRGAALDTYTGRAWIAATPPSSRDDQIGPLPAGSRKEIGAGGAEREKRLAITIRNAPPGPSHLFTVWRPLTVTFLDGGSEYHNPFTGIVLRDGQGGKFRYEVECGEPRAPRGNFWRRHERPSFPVAGVRGRAIEILTQAGVELDEQGNVPLDRMREAAIALRSELRNQYAYTLDSAPTPPGVDPIEHFLTASRAGHCEHFASAMAAMCRSVGIDARVITGYVAVEYSQATGHYIVRESNAHAWVEVEEGPGYWRVHDPTAPADLRRLHAPRPGLLARASRFLDAIEYAWITSVVGFDSSSRSSLFAWARREDLSGDGPFAGVAGDYEMPDWNWWARVIVNALVASSIVLACGLGAAAIARRVTAARAARARSRSTIEDPEVRARVQQASFYADALGLLEAAGLGKPEHRPPEHHADALAGLDAALAEGLRAVAGLYYVARFGGRGLSADELDRARAALSGLRDRLRVVAGSEAGYQAPRPHPAPR